MRILYVCNEYPPAHRGGLGIYTQRAAQVMAAKGHLAFVIGYLPFVGQRMDGAVTVISLRKWRLPALRALFWRIELKRAIEALVAEKGIDLVEAPESEGWLPFGLNNCKVALRLHMSSTQIQEDTGAKLSRMVRWFERQSLRRNREWLPVSRSALDKTKRRFKIRPSRSIVLFPFLPKPQRHEERRTTLRLPARFVLFAGGLRWRKGAFLAAEATALLLRRDAKMHAVYAGSGEASARARMLASFDPKDRDRVHFLGQLGQAELMGTMRKASVFLFLSYLDAFGMVLSEAASAGCPIVTTEAGCVPEILVPGEHVWGCQGMDAPGISRLMERVLRSPKLAKGRASKAKSRVKSLMSEGRLAKAYLEAYSRI